jgi:uncharacterized membrane protein
MFTRSAGAPAAPVIAAALAALGLPSCSQDGAQDAGSGATCPSDSTLTYANFGQMFIADNCLRCHSRREPTLQNHAAIQANLDGIDRVAAAGPKSVNTTMPEGASVTVEQRTLLGEWLACGAP